MSPRWIPLVLGALAPVVLLTPEIRATLLAYDGFEDYSTAGGWTGMSATNGGTGWSGNWTGGTADTFPSADRTVSYSSGSVAVDGGGTTLFRDDVGTPTLQRSWTTGVDLTNAANAVYVSFLWQTLSADGATYTGSGTDSFFQVTVGEVSVPTTYGVYNRGNENHTWRARYANSSTSSGVAIAADTTYFVVFKLDRTGASVWINPTSATEVTADAVKTGTALTGTNWDGVNTIILRSAVAAANYNIDELRVGTTFADVVPVIPEMSTFAVAMGGSALLAAAWRRRRAP